MTSPREDPPPTEDLVGPEPRALDEEALLDHFLGKTREDIRALLPASGHYQEDFGWMLPEGLRYDLPAVLDYLKSDESRQDWHMSEGLLGSLSFQVRHTKLPDDVLRLIGSIADYVDQNRTKFLFEWVSPEFERSVRDIREALRGG